MRHLPSLLLLAGLAVLHTWPLAMHVGDRLPGRDLGDNVQFAWNIWWMREAIARPDVSFFYTSYQFAPVGTSLVLHTHTSLPALAAATLLPGLPVVAALDLVILAAVFLNGASAYALAVQVVRARMPALLAGVLFMLSPPLLARLMGHFNLIHAWALVGAVWLGLRALEGRTWGPPSGGPLMAGIALGLVAYVDYYLFVYACGITAIVVLFRQFEVGIVWAPRLSVGSRICFGLAAFAFVVTVVIAMSGGFDVDLLGAHVSMRGVTNPLTAMWLFAVAGALLRLRPRVRVALSQSAAASALQLALLAGGCAATLAPLIVLAVRLWLAGEYVSPATFWRSAQPGADVATFFMGPPFNGVIGAAVRSVYSRLDLDVMEMSGWLGVCAPVLALLALRQYGDDARVRMWRPILLLFLVWSLGPFLYAGSLNTHLVLPQQFARFIPILANARIPARGLIVVSLALSVLAAIWAANRSPRIVVLLLVAATIELAGAPLPLVSTATPSIYAVLRDQPPGTVLELPFGYRDGFGYEGRFEDATLLFQTTHRHPMAGGFVARLPPSVRRFYAEQPVFRALTELSAGRDAASPGCPETVRALTDAGIRYVVMNEPAVPPALAEYARAWPLTRVAAVDGRTLLQLGAACN